MKEKSKPQIISNLKLHDLTSGQLASVSSSDKLINYLDLGLAEYECFRQERFIKKKKKLDDTIKRFKLLSFSSKDSREKDNKLSVTKVKKTTEKLLTKSTKYFDITKSRGVELKDLLKYDHFGGNTLFENNGLKKHNKAEILQEVEIIF